MIIHLLANLRSLIRYYCSTYLIANDLFEINESGFSDNSRLITLSKKNRKFDFKNHLELN